MPQVINISRSHNPPITRLASLECISDTSSYRSEAKSLQLAAFLTALSSSSVFSSSLKSRFCLDESMRFSCWHELKVARTG
jgi:hypothetical protein